MRRDEGEKLGVGHRLGVEPNAAIGFDDVLGAIAGAVRVLTRWNGCTGRPESRPDALGRRVREPQEPARRREHGACDAGAARITHLPSPDAP